MNLVPMGQGFKADELLKQYQEMCVQSYFLNYIYILKWALKRNRGFLLQAASLAVLQQAG